MKFKLGKKYKFKEPLECVGLMDGVATFLSEDQSVKLITGESHSTVGWKKAKPDEPKTVGSVVVAISPTSGKRESFTLTNDRAWTDVNDNGFEWNSLKKKKIVFVA